MLLYKVPCQSVKATVLYCLDVTPSSSTCFHTELLMYWFWCYFLIIKMCIPCVLESCFFPHSFNNNLTQTTGFKLNGEIEIKDIKLSRMEANVNTKVSEKGSSMIPLFEFKDCLFSWIWKASFFSTKKTPRLLQKKNIFGIMSDGLWTGIYKSKRKSAGEPTRAANLWNSNRGSAPLTSMCMTSVTCVPKHALHSHQVADMVVTHYRNSHLQPCEAALHSVDLHPLIYNHWIWV